MEGQSQEMPIYMGPSLPNAEPCYNPISEVLIRSYQKVGLSLCEPPRAVCSRAAQNRRGPKRQDGP